MKKLRKIMAFLLALVMVLALCACAKPMPIGAGKTTVGVKDGETVGQGATAFSVEVKDAEGKTTKFTVQTDEKTVGAALQKLNIIAGEASDYGLYICSPSPPATWSGASASRRTTTRTAPIGRFMLTGSMPSPAWI